MMKVRILSDVSVPDERIPFRTAFAFQQGDTPTVPDELGAEWIGCGMAEAVDTNPEVKPAPKMKANKRHVI